MRSAVGVSVLLLLAVAVRGYDEILAKYKMWPMAGATFGSHPEKCVHDNFNSSDFQRRIEVPCDLVQGDTCVSFSAVSHTDRAIILAFRGSTGSEVAVEVIDGILKKPVAPFASGGNVNEFFLNAFTTLWVSGAKEDFVTLKNRYPTYELWVTGHSLGGAIAAVAAATVADQKLFDASRIKLVTFGEPRVGDAGFAAAVDSLLPNAIRIVHRHDIVPHLPYKGFHNYRHHKSEVWYNNDMSYGSSYVVCEEDEGAQCSDSMLELVGKDHDNYWNVDTDFADDGCVGWNQYKNQ